LAGVADKTCFKAEVNACDSRGGSPEFFLGESDDDDI
jgi:hypothetical protein